MDVQQTVLADQVAAKLDWDAFCVRYFRGRRRHDLEALASYAAYKDGRAWHATPHLTLVPNQPVSPPIEAESDGAADRLLVAVSAVPALQVWEGEGGFTP
jgi:hypothetical protein